MRTCPKCGAQLDEQALGCPYCPPANDAHSPLAAPPVLKPGSQPPPLPVRPRSPQYLPPPGPAKNADETSWLTAVGGVFMILFLLAVAVVGGVLIFQDAPHPRARVSPPPPPQTYPSQVRPGVRPVTPPVRVYPNSTNLNRPATQPWPVNQWATMSEAQKRQAMEVLLTRLKSESFALRRSGAEAMGGLGREAEEAIPQLEALTGDTNACVRHAAAYALGAIGSDSDASIQALQKLLKDPDEHVRPFAATALQRVQPGGSEAYDIYQRERLALQAGKGTATAGTYNDLAWQLVQQKKNPQIALEYARRAAALAPNDCNIKDTLGWAYLRNDRYAEALRTFADVITNHRFGERGVASSWRGVMEVAQASAETAQWQAFVDVVAQDASDPTMIRLNAIQAEVHRRQGQREKARDYWRQTGFLPETNWLILAPLDNLGGALMRNDALPDNGLTPDLDKLHQGRRGPCRWEQRGDGLMDGYIDLKSMTGDETDWLGAYAWISFDVSAAREAQLRVGSDDQITLWLNGGLVHKIGQSRTANIDQDVVLVQLKAGANTLIVKCCNTTQDWGFYVRLTGEVGQPLKELISEK